MKHFTALCIIFVFSFSAFAGLKSGCKPTAKGFTILNSHEVGSSKIVRGMAPTGKVGELLREKITDVVIFKSQTRKEVDKELVALKDAGFLTERVRHIPFKWHGFESFRVACEQTIEALQIFKEVLMSKDRRLFFHCTVGEDRTGFLAGIWRMMLQKWSAPEAFYRELCENCYGSGNPNKPFKVVGKIRNELTSLYLKMATLVKNNKLTMMNIDKSVCLEEEGEKDVDASLYVCRAAEKSVKVVRKPRGKRPRRRRRHQ